MPSVLFSTSPSQLRYSQSLLLVCAFLISPHLHPSQAQGMQEVCSRSSPGECRANEWFNAETSCCQTCTDCSTSNGEIERFAVAQCNVTHDAECDCNMPTFLDTTTNQCLLHCEFCPLGRCSAPGVCECDERKCHTSDDIYCRNPRNCATIPPPVEPTRIAPPPFSEQDTLPPWGIGLIAVGIVIGIIIFASCFLCLGLFTMHKTQDPESQQSSETSENGLVPRGSLGSIGTNSTYTSSTVYPYLSSHSMLELLKHSNSQIVCPSDRLSSLQSSPVSARSSPKPGRTVKLMKCPDSDKLKAIML